MVKLSMYHDVIKDLNPDDYTMDEIKKQMAICNRLYYLKLKQTRGVDRKQERERERESKGLTAKRQ